MMCVITAAAVCREFDASVMILHHSTTIACGYQPVIHCGVLRQSASIVDIQGNDKRLKTGESKSYPPLTSQPSNPYPVLS